MSVYVVKYRKFDFLNGLFFLIFVSFIYLIDFFFFKLFKVVKSNNLIIDIFLLF